MPMAEHRTGPVPDAGRPGGDAALPRVVGDATDAACGTVGVSESWLAVVDSATRAGQSDARVIITGESGVGKDVVAKLIHSQSKRAHRAFVAINCAGVAETLLESELFGHAKGSFTGAWRDTRGLARAADGGTLFLDEVGEMSLRMQAVLLRFVETGEIQPVGADAPVARTNVRIIAATNRRLPDMAAAGQFRFDLLYRLSVIQIHVAPLRERRDDIGALIAHCLARQPKPTSLTPAAQLVLERYHWPGNVRELQNVIEQAVWSAGGDVVDVRHLPEAVRPHPVIARAVRDRRRTQADRLYDALVAGRCSFWDDVQKWFLERDLTRNDIRSLTGLGLAHTRGNYHALLALFRIPADDYKRFLNFLSAHHCSVDVLPYRRGTGNPREVYSSSPLDEPGPGREVPRA